MATPASGPDSGLKEILALADCASGPMATDIFQYVADSLLEGRARPGEGDYEAALALLRRIRPHASAACKAQVARRLCCPAQGRLDLVLVLLEDGEEVWGPLLREIRLEEVEWLALLPRLCPEARRAVAAQRGLPAWLRLVLAGAPSRTGQASQGSSGAGTLRPEVFYPARVVERVIAAMGDHARRRDQVLAGAVEPGLEPVVGDAVLLERALGRLAGLACDAAGPGERLVIGVRRAGVDGLAYTLTRPAALSADGSAALRPVEAIIQALGGHLVLVETQLVLYFRLPRAQPPRAV